MSAPRQPSFKKLQKTWYKKLKKSGFEDIEYSDGSSKSCKPRTPRGLDPSLRQSIIDYYNMCDAFLNDHTFETELDKVMWEYHSNGISNMDIVLILKQTKVKKTNRDWVQKRLKDLKEQMKKRYLSP
jgi:hypothetical protein